MKSQELIEQYSQSVEQQQEERLKKIKDLSAKIDAVMAQNVDIWLGDLINEFELGEAKVDGSYSQGYFKISRAITWGGVTGQISMYVDRNGYDYRADNTYLLFSLPQQHFFGKTPSADSLKEKIELPFGRDYENFEGWRFTNASAPADPISLGKMFKNIKAAVAEREEKQRISDEEKRLSRIEDLKGHWDYSRKNDYWREQFDTAKHLDQCMTEFPELSEEWNQLSNQYIADENASKAVIAEQVRIEAEKRAQYVGEESRLENQVASHFEPIILYRVQYGARTTTEDGEPDFYTASMLVLSDEPDKDGWYYSIHRGEIKRVKFTNVIAFEELIFNSEHEIPDSWPECPFAKAFIKSEIFDDLKRWYFVVPVEVTRLSEVE